MTPKEFADIASAIAWPLVAVAFVAAFYKPVRAVLERLAATLTIKTVKIKAFGAELELTPEQAKQALNELLQDIADVTNELTPEESALFEKTLHADGRFTVANLCPGFVRDSKEHQQLRKLRDHKLIRPFEGDRWQAGKHPVPTRFGQMVYNLKNAQRNPS
jgi:hypothetical protein